MNNKVLVTVNVPSLEKSFDVFIPVNRRVHSVVKMIGKSLVDLSFGAFDPNKNYAFYNEENGAQYDMNMLVRNTDIRNGSKVIMI